MSVVAATLGRRSAGGFMEDTPALLCSLIRRALDGDVPELPSVASPAPLGQLLNAVRRCFLDEAVSAETALSPAASLRIIAAIDRVQEVVEQDATPRFVSHFTGPDALASVVEIAHDMRSPLSSVLFLVETLRKGHSGPVSALQERQLGLVYSATFGLSSMVNDLIELARGGERLTEVTPIPLSLSEIMVSIHDIVRPIAEEKRLTLELELPEADYRLGHPVALSRVLLNLTINALKFTDQGGVTVTANPVSRSTVEFVVRDTGRGIPRELMTNLFDAFRPSERGRAGGFMFSSAGLGLSICQKLARAMGGELSAESTPGQGTCFRFMLDMPIAPRL